MPDTFKDYLERNIKKVVTKFTDMIQNVTPFIGTEAEWNALSAAEQAKYNIKDIIGEGGDYGPGIAPAWYTGETYTVGDVRLWTNGHTYICKLAHTSSSSITPANTTYWEDKTLGEMISSLNSNYTNLSSKIRVIDATTPNATGTEQKIIADTSLIGNYAPIGISINLGNDQWLWIPKNSSLIIYGSGVFCSVDDSNLKNKSCKVLLLKIS